MVTVNDVGQKWRQSGRKHHYFDATQIASAVVALGEKKGSTLHSICKVLRSQCQNKQCNKSCNCCRISLVDVKRQLKQCINEGILSKKRESSSRFILYPEIFQEIKRLDKGRKTLTRRKNIEEAAVRPRRKIRVSAKIGKRQSSKLQKIYRKIRRGKTKAKKGRKAKKGKRSTRKRRN